MTTVANTRQQIEDALDALSADQLAEVLDFIQHIQKRPQGIEGKELAEFIRGLPETISPEEAQQMDAILEEIRAAGRSHG
jgi:hypothetical protein